MEYLDDDSHAHPAASALLAHLLCVLLFAGATGSARAWAQGQDSFPVERAAIALDTSGTKSPLRAALEAGCGADSTCSFVIRECKTDARQCSSLANAYLEGHFGLPQDGVRAVAVFLHGCAANDVNACTMAANAFMQGRGGVQKDDAKAIAPAREACRLGDETMCMFLWRPEYIEQATPEDRAYGEARLRGVCDGGETTACEYLRIWHGHAAEPSLRQDAPVAASPTSPIPQEGKEAAPAPTSVATPEVGQGAGRGFVTQASAPGAKEGEDLLPIGLWAASGAALASAAAFQTAAFVHWQHARDASFVGRQVENASAASAQSAARLALGTAAVLGLGAWAADWLQGDEGTHHAGAGSFGIGLMYGLLSPGKYNQHGAGLTLSHQRFLDGRADHPSFLGRALALESSTEAHLWIGSKRLGKIAGTVVGVEDMALESESRSGRGIWGQGTSVLRLWYHWVGLGAGLNVSYYWLENQVQLLTGDGPKLSVRALRGAAGPQLAFGLLGLDGQPAGLDPKDSLVLSLAWWPLFDGTASSFAVGLDIRTTSLGFLPHAWARFELLRNATPVPQIQDGIALSAGTEFLFW